MKFSPMTEAELIRSLDKRCPSCLIAWWLFPPVKIKQSGPPKVRCIECKDVFDADVAT